MATSDYVYGNKQWEINLWILSLSTLGLATKLLEVDLAGFSIFGLNLGGNNTALVPGFIGLALFYAFLSYIVARMELQIAHSTETINHLQPMIEKIRSSKLLAAIFLLFLPLPLITYTIIPVFLSLFTLYVLWPEISVVVQVLLNAI